MRNIYHGSVYKLFKNMWKLILLGNWNIWHALIYYGNSIKHHSPKSYSEAGIQFPQTYCHRVGVPLHLHVLCIPQPCHVRSRIISIARGNWDLKFTSSWDFNALTWPPLWSLRQMTSFSRKTASDIVTAIECKRFAGSSINKYCRFNSFSVVSLAIMCFKSLYIILSISVFRKNSSL